MTKAVQPQLLCARWILHRAGVTNNHSKGTTRVSRDGGLLVRGGVIQQVVQGHSACQRLLSTSGAKLRDLGGVCLIPGLVNAHAHLELTGFEGALPRKLGFGSWVRELLAAKRESGEFGLLKGAGEGLVRVLAGGSTTVGDIASTGAMWAVLENVEPVQRPRLRLYREVLDAWDPLRTSSALALLDSALQESPFVFEGYSPHAPFTVSSDLLRGLARIHLQRPRPLTMHWAETQAELDWMENGQGEFQVALGASPHTSGLKLLDDVGLLEPWTSLVHGNLPARGEIERIAAAGASVVHCPGTHAFFERTEFPLDDYLKAGVNVALGTDSLASNDNLNIVVEAGRLLAREPSVSPLQVLGMATEGGARALGLDDRVGQLEPGFFADALVLPVGNLVGEAGPGQLAEHLLTSWARPVVKERRPLEVLVGGISVRTA